MGIFSRFSKKEEKSEEKIFIDISQALKSLNKGRSFIARNVLEGYTKARDTYELKDSLSTANQWITEALNRLYVLGKNFKSEKGSYRGQNILAQFNNTLENLRAINENLAKSTESLSERTLLAHFGIDLTQTVEQLQAVKSNLESIFSSNR